VCVCVCSYQVKGWVDLRPKHVLFVCCRTLAGNKLKEINNKMFVGLAHLKTL